MMGLWNFKYPSPDPCTWGFVKTCQTKTAVLPVKTSQPKDLWPQRPLMPRRNPPAERSPAAVMVAPPCIRGTFATEIHGCFELENGSCEPTTPTNISKWNRYSTLIVALVHYISLHIHSTHQTCQLAGTAASSLNDRTTGATLTAMIMTPPLERPIACRVNIDCKRIVVDVC